MTSASAAAMLQALGAGEPAPALAGKLALYGRFIGSWQLDVTYYPGGGTPLRAEGEWHFAWALDGRAVQDVWIFPARHLRQGGQPAEPWHMYGTTVRWYDPTIDAWRITWFDPSRPFELRQIGRAVGPDIVQLGEDRNGLYDRWRFVEIGADSFRWLADRSWDRGANWTLLMEMQARRVPEAPS